MINKHDKYNVVGNLHNGYYYWEPFFPGHCPATEY